MVAPYLELYGSHLRAWELQYMGVALACDQDFRVKSRRQWRHDVTKGRVSVSRQLWGENSWWWWWWWCVCVCVFVCVCVCLCHSKERKDWQWNILRWVMMSCLAGENTHSTSIKQKRRIKSQSKLSPGAEPEFDQGWRATFAMLKHKICQKQWTCGLFVQTRSTPKFTWFLARISPQKSRARKTPVLGSVFCWSPSF